VFGFSTDVCSFGGFTAFLRHLVEIAGGSEFHGRPISHVDHDDEVTDVYFVSRTDHGRGRDPSSVEVRPIGAFQVDDEEAPILLHQARVALRDVALVEDDVIAGHTSYGDFVSVEVHAFRCATFLRHDQRQHRGSRLLRVVKIKYHSCVAGARSLKRVRFARAPGGACVRIRSLAPFVAIVVSQVPSHQGLRHRRRHGRSAPAPAAIAHE